MKKQQENLSNFSLQLLTMPDFMRSLKLGPAVGDSNRSSYIGKSERYGTKTLEGHWQDRRATEQLVRLPINSTYRVDYKAIDHEKAIESKVNAFNLRDDQWVIGQGLPYNDLIREGAPHEYQKNHSSLYDLTYGGACPELNRSRKAAVVTKITAHKPENDYALDYGNLSDHGYRTFKVNEWTNEEETMKRLTTSTMYKDDFVEMPLEKIDKLRSPLKICSSSFNKILLDNQNFKPRNSSFRFVNENCFFTPKKRKPISIVPELD